MRSYYSLTRRGRAGRLRRAVSAALERYDLAPEALRLITNETNGIFRLDTADGRKLVVRVGLGGEIAHSTGQVAAETEWLAALAEDGSVTVPEPVRTADGSLFVTVEAEGVPDPRNVVIFTWLPGVVLDERMTGENIHAWGALAARLHRQGARHRPSDPDAIARYDRINPFEEPMILLETDDPLMTRERRLVFSEAWERVEEEIGGLQRSGEPMRVLHGDLHIWNVMVSRRGLAAFDFEDVMWGWPVQDTATMLWYLQRRPRYSEWLPVFRAGYESVSPWPEMHDGQLVSFLIGRYLVLGNDLLITPEWRDEAEGGLARFEEHVRRLLAHGRISE